MRHGLFGKLPSKRDFIAVDTPRPFLGVWETWLQSGIAASRQALGDGWRDAFLQAPIWRFWLGGRICGSPVLGALMPSIDGVGRYFPLTLIAHDDAPSGTRAALPPPEADPQEAWFQRAESFLIDALDEGRAYEDTLRNLAALPLPEAPEAEGKVDEQVAVLSNVDPGLIRSAFAQLREQDTACFHSGMTFWWTAGGEDYPGIAAAQSGMPDPYFLAGVLTGRFAAGSKRG